MTSAGPAVERGTVEGRVRPGSSFLTRREHFRQTTSTNDVVAGWLAGGAPEVCLATADEQTRGRGREGRTWQAPPAGGLLLSIGFRPTWLAADRAWQLAAIASLAMADAAARLADLAPGTVRLKWPNDLVVEANRQGPDGEEKGDDSPRAAEVRSSGSAAQLGGLRLRKLAGVLGETTGLGTDDPRVVIGIGINVDWARADFPADLAAGMTSLRDASGDRPIDRDRLLNDFLEGLEPRVRDLRTGQFPATEWQAHQVTTGRAIDLVHHDGARTTVRAIGVDAGSGGLIVEEGGSTGHQRTIHSGEVLHVRFADSRPPARERV